MNRGAFGQFPFRWIYYCHSSKSAGKVTAKTHLFAMGGVVSVGIFVKVHIFWEVHKIFAKSLPIICPMYCQSNNWWRFRKILWPSHNIWTLQVCQKALDNIFYWFCFQYHLIIYLDKDNCFSMFWIKYLQSSGMTGYPYTW